MTRAQTPAERQRAYRERVRQGRRVVPVEVDAALVEDGLVASGFLRREDADNPKKVADAIREAVAQLITPPAEPDNCAMHNAIDLRTVLR
jgi:hypothetical protein